jgi:hypothetical protein
MDVSYVTLDGTGRDPRLLFIVTCLQDVYPMDERHWLLGTAFNMATECL